jgi:hypothetical protein
MRALANLISRKVSSLLGTTHLKKVSEEITNLRSIVENIHIDKFLEEKLFLNPAYRNSKKITHYHKSVFAQNGEDGILEEIFKRIGSTNKYFVEFGVHGVKNNSTLLLVKDWCGLWIGGDKTAEATILKDFRQVIDEGRLKYASSWIVRENINETFANNNVPQEPDFLSIDLDGNDYWIWQAITRYSPRVVCVEYNATFPPDISWVMTYNANHVWGQTSYFGASLKALENLGHEKGYELIGCDFTGCNAFFLRKDQRLELFESPFTAENHYEPPRYFLGRPSGHQQGFGAYTTRS